MDAEVATEIAAAELCKVEPVMEDRPKHTVGEAVVIFLEILLRKIGQHIREARPFDQLRAYAIAGNDRAAPAEPNATMFLEGGTENDLEATGALLCAGIWHAIGNKNQPRQYRSSQLRDKRIAVRMSPAME